jgi:hypothetical protein
VGLLGFRDVFQVDGRRVRDRDARLERLFLTPSAEGVEQAKRVLDESARYNVGATRRNYNLPTIALAILHPAARERFSFRDEGARKVKGRAARAIAFDEQTTPTLIRDPERDREYFSRGMFLIEIETGALLRSELRLQHEGGRAAIEVEYEWHPALALWLPETMSETLESRFRAPTLGSSARGSLEPFGGVGETLIGQARYRKPRRFTVTTEEKIQRRSGPRVP